MAMSGLKVIEDIIKTFCDGLEGQAPKPVYFDAFSFSGETKARTTSPVFQKLGIETKDINLFRGMVEKVMAMDKPFPFDHYYFMERSEAAKEKTDERIKKTGWNNCLCLSTDANAEIRKLANTVRRKETSALLLLDTVGLNISWRSITAFRGSTATIIIVISVASVINRLLSENGTVRSHYLLAQLLGTDRESMVELFKQKRDTAEIIKTIAFVYGERIATLCGNTVEIKEIVNERKVTFFYLVIGNMKGHYKN